MIEGLIGLAKALNDIREDAQYYREKAASAETDEARAAWTLKAEICDDNAAMVKRREEEAWCAVSDDWMALRRLARERFDAPKP